jgi:hypothetical protein
MNKICSSERTSNERVDHLSRGSADSSVLSDVREDVSMAERDERELAVVRMGAVGFEENDRNQ